MTQILKPTDTPQRACSPDEPVMVAWKAYQATDDYKNTRNWALHEKHVDGSLWGAFSHGFLTRHFDPDELREALGRARAFIEGCDLTRDEILAIISTALSRNVGDGG